MKKTITVQFLLKNGVSPNKIQEYYDIMTVLRKKIHPNIALAPSPKEYYLKGSKQIPVFVQEFIPQELNAIILCQHGNTIQGDLIYPLADFLFPHGIGVISVDNSGHGRSGKRRGDFHQPEIIFPVYTEILQKYIQQQIPCHILGESLGCTVVTKYLIEYPQIQKQISSVILQVPPYRVRILCRISVFIPILKFLLLCLHYLIGQYPIFPSNPGNTPSYFTEFRAWDRIDTIRQPRTTMRHFAYALFMLDLFHKVGHQIKKPHLILQGTADSILEPEGAIQLFNTLKHVKRRIRLFKNADHSLFYDLNSQQIYEEILNWIQKNS
jgi:acylglycerol lipase